MNFYSYGAEELGKLNKKYDILYCKALEHISNLALVIKNFSLASKKDLSYTLNIGLFFPI